MARRILQGRAAVGALLGGIDRMTGLLRPTLGPLPRTVAIQRLVGSGPPEILDTAALNRAAGGELVLVRLGMERGVAVAVDALRRQARTIDDLGKARQAWATPAAFGILGGQGRKVDVRQRIAETRAELAAIDGDPSAGLGTRQSSHDGPLVACAKGDPDGNGQSDT